MEKILIGSRASQTSTLFLLNLSPGTHNTTNTTKILLKKKSLSEFDSLKNQVPYFSVKKKITAQWNVKK